MASADIDTNVTVGDVPLGHHDDREIEETIIASIQENQSEPSVGETSRRTDAHFSEESSAPPPYSEIDSTPSTDPVHRSDTFHNHISTDDEFVLVDNDHPHTDLEDPFADPF